MADKDDKNKNQDEKTEKDEKTQPAKTKIGILTWIIMITVVALLAGSGFILGRLFAGPSSAGKADAVHENQQDAEQSKHGEEKSKSEGHGGKAKKSAVAESGSGDTWYYNDLESIVVNPDEPGATRFVRVGLILEISIEISPDKAKEIIDSQKPILINWVNLYFKSLTLDQMRNDRDMKRIQLQILDAFNEMLFPDSKPQIKRVLIREFNIQ